MAVTGANGHVGRKVLARLASLSNPVRPLGRDDDWAEGVSDTVAVIHLAGTLQPKRHDTYWSANVDPARRITDAVAGTPVGRIVFLSYLGADPISPNPYLRAKGQAEELLQASGIPTVVFRSTLVYGDQEDIGPSFDSYQAEANITVSVLGDGNQLVAPLHVSDLADMLNAAALDPETPTGTFEVGGTEVFTLDDFIRRINPDGVRIRHLPPILAALLVRLLPQLTPALVEVLLSDSVPRGNPAEAAARYGVSLP